MNGMGKRIRRKKRIIRLAVLAAVIAAVLVILVVFHVREVRVYGNDRHASGEIASGLVNDFPSGNTLYLLWKYRKEEVPDTLPYLRSLSVKMKSPSCIEVQVSEKELVGYIDKGEYVYFDQSGVALEITDEIYDDVPIVTGIDTEEVVLYQKLPAKSSAQLSAVLNLTQLLAYQGLVADEIRFGENMDITVFLGGVEVRLGQNEYLEEKIANLRAIMEKMDGSDRGVLHLESFTGKNEAVTFSKSDEPEQVTDEMGSADGTSSGEDTGSADGTSVGDGTGTAEGASAGDGTGTADGSSSGDGAGPEDEMPAEPTDDGTVDGPDLMVFNSSNTLVYNVHVVNGTVVDAYGNPVPGCTVNENGYVVDAYMNVIDPATGQLVQ